MGVAALRRAVFLDRDGTLIAATVREGRPYPPQNVQDLTILPGVPEALARLREAGFELVVVTNQPDVARGRQTREIVEAINALMGDALGLTDIRVCWHDDPDDCACRKPRPGLIVDAARDGGVDLAASFVVGDRWRDVAAGQAAGCRTVLIDCGYDEAPCPAPPDCQVATLSEAAEWILAQPPSRSLP
jgi:D-glycero-D-manno-heptose 1,7-bisphosphate phosphatase